MTSTTIWNDAIHDLYDQLALPPTTVGAADQDLPGLRARLGALMHARPAVDLPADLAHAQVQLDAAVSRATDMAHAAPTGDDRERQRVAEALADVIRAMPPIVEWARVTR